MKSFHIHAMAFAIIAMSTFAVQAQSDGIRVTGTSAVKKNPASDNPLRNTPPLAIHYTNVSISTT